MASFPQASPPTPCAQRRGYDVHIHVILQGFYSDQWHCSSYRVLWRKCKQRLKMTYGVAQGRLVHFRTHFCPTMGEWGVEPGRREKRRRAILKPMQRQWSGGSTQCVNEGRSFIFTYMALTVTGPHSPVFIPIGDFWKNVCTGIAHRMCIQE